TIRAADSLTDSSPLPAQLVKIDWRKETDATVTRKFDFQMNMGPSVMVGLVDSHVINGKAMKMSRIDETVKLDTTEIWEISNSSFMAHPFHVHDVQFHILDRNGKQPSPGERGRKDTVLVNPGETVRIIMKFEDFADPNSPFMYHCHILEHEDAGMMGQFVVV
ncbi:MAG: multicopper oxidase domain-containing protein, partial [Rhizobiaceae bacterium]|nr:multicopper oxidase domain-containing protein [Rhizobiaceae bacterium]